MASEETTRPADGARVRVRSSGRYGTVVGEVSVYVIVQLYPIFPAREGARLGYLPSEIEEIAPEPERSAPIVTDYDRGPR